MHLYGANEAVTPLPVPELGAVVGSASVVVGSVVSSSVVGSVVSSVVGSVVYSVVSSSDVEYSS